MYYRFFKVFLSICQKSASIAKIASSLTEKSNGDVDPGTINFVVMMQKLFGDQESKQQQFFKEFEDRQNSALKYTIVPAIAEQIQPLSVAFDVERAELIQVVADVQ